MLLGKKAKGICAVVFFVFFDHFPFCVWLPRPSHFVHLNLTYDFSLIAVIILLIMAMTLYIPPFPVALRIAAFLLLLLTEGGEFHLDRGLVCTDLLPETQPAHLLDFHNCHYCTPQELDRTHTAYKVWMAALYGILEQLCGNQMCTILIFKKNIKACQTIRNHELDPL